MRIAITAPGSRGDVQPYMALGKGLQEAGHAVRLVTHQNFDVLVSSHGLDFWPVGGSAQDITQSKEMRERLGKGNFLAVMSQMAREAQRGAVALAEGGLDAALLDRATLLHSEALRERLAQGRQESFIDGLLKAETVE